MSDAQYQVEEFTNTPLFLEDITPIENYWLVKQLEEEYYYEQMMEGL